MITRKTNNANLERKVPLFFRIGLIISIFITIVAFEWESPYSQRDIEEPTDFEFFIEEEMSVVIIKEKPRKLVVKPKSIIKKIISVDNSKEIEINAVPNVIVKNKGETNKIIEIPKIAEPDDAKDEPLYGSEIKPSFPGGEEMLLKYLEENIKYPEKARINKIEGVVYLSFVVNKFGEIVDIKVLRGIGGGCEQEAVKVLNKMPKWSPGIQSGKLVSVMYSLPVNFRLPN